MLGLRRFVSSQQNVLAIAAAVLLAFSFAFGGASRLNLGRLAVVELAALPALVMSLSMLTARAGALGRHRLSLAILAGLAAIPLLQLIPLPPQIWTALPGREASLQALAAAGVTPGWSPASLAPDATWRSLLALLPPIALFLSLLAGGAVLGVRLVGLFLAGVLIVVALCALQLVTGTDQFAPWAASDPSEVVGIFANRNHLATLCLVALPFTLTAAVLASDRRTSLGRLLIWLAPVLAGLLLVILGIAKSRAGVLLAAPALLLGLAAARMSLARTRSRWILPSMIGGGLLAVAAVAAFAFAPTLTRFQSTGVDDPRFEHWALIAETAPAYLPVGSGIGSFDAVYRSVEPLAQLDPTYFNQAHNEYLESWLETGWLGLALLAAFLVWFGRRSWAAWSQRGSASEAMARAAGAGVVLILVHSGFDYPLRTETIACVFALCCGLLELSRRDVAVGSGSAPD